LSQYLLYTYIFVITA